eukprot:SAG11_NODE_127_length_15677_cov_10.890872_2_plen_173_part_00
MCTPSPRFTYAYVVLINKSKVMGIVLWSDNKLSLHQQKKGCRQIRSMVLREGSLVVTRREHACIRKRTASIMTNLRLYFPYSSASRLSELHKMLRRESHARVRGQKQQVRIVIAARTIERARRRRRLARKKEQQTHRIDCLECLRDVGAGLSASKHDFARDENEQTDLPHRR